MKRIFTFIVSHPIIGILFVSICLRIFYYFYNPNPIITPDTFGYQSRAVKLKTGNPLLVVFSDERVPLYPLTLSILTNPQVLMNPFQIPPSFPGFEKIIFFQSLLGLGIVIVSVLILSLLSSPSWLTFIIGIVIGTNTTLLFYEHTILPETLATFLLSVFAYVTLLCIRKASGEHTFFLVCVSLLLFLTKPIFILLPFPVFVFLALNQIDRRKLIHSSLSIIVYSLCIGVYIWGNGELHGYHGINHAGDINLLGRIIQFDFPIESENNVSFFAHKLIEYKALGLSKDPYRFLEWSDEAIYGTGWLLEDLRKFVGTTIRKNLFTYIQLSLPDIIPALITTDAIPNVYNRGGTLSYETIFLNILDGIQTTFRYTNLLLLFLFPLYGMSVLDSFFHKKQFLTYFGMLFVLSGIAIYMALTAALGSYDSFGRLATPMLPIGYIVIGMSIWKSFWKTK